MLLFLINMDHGKIPSSPPLKALKWAVYCSGVQDTIIHEIKGFLHSCIVTIRFICEQSMTIKQDEVNLCKQRHNPIS